jgi:hypothetical protein
MFCFDVFYVATNAMVMCFWLVFLPKEMCSIGYYLFSFLDRFQVWSFVEDPHVVSSDRLEAQHQLQNETGSSSASLRLLSRSRAAFNSVNLVNLGLG